MTGRRPKPTSLKRLAGNPGHRPLNLNEPQPTGIPKCPSHLDKVARAEWKRISKELIALGLLTAVDRAALAAYCAAYSRWVTAELELQRINPETKLPVSLAGVTKSGYIAQNPFVGIANVAMDHMRKFLTEFGMTPASRSRIDIEPPSRGITPFEEFMSSIGADDIVSPNESASEPCEPRS